MITIESLIRTASGMASGVIAVAAAHDEEVLKAVCEAKRKNIANAILVGNVIRIKSILSELGEEDSGFELIPADSDADCAAKAVSAVRSGRANLLMKGILNTADLMRAVLDKENGIRTERLISHVMLYQPAGYRLMAVTDGGMNPFPDLAKKTEILENAAITMKSIGFGNVCSLHMRRRDGKPKDTVYGGRAGACGYVRALEQVRYAGLRPGRAGSCSEPGGLRT